MLFKGCDDDDDDDDIADIVNIDDIGLDEI